MLEEDSLISGGNEQYDHSNMRNSDKYYISSGLLFNSGVTMQMISPKHKHNISNHTGTSSNLIEDCKLVFPNANEHGSPMEDGGTGGVASDRKNYQSSCDEE